MAVDEGFEPSRHLAAPYRFSKPASSATWVTHHIRQNISSERDYRKNEGKSKIIYNIQFVMFICWLKSINFFSSMYSFSFLLHTFVTKSIKSFGDEPNSLIARFAYWSTVYHHRSNSVLPPNPQDTVYILFIFYSSFFFPFSSLCKFCVSVSEDFRSKLSTVWRLKGGVLRV